MFLGHYAAAYAAKRLVPGTSLGTLFIAAQLVDLLWPLFLLLGIEHVRIAPGITLMTPLDFHDYPITHSLVGALAWSAGFGGLIWAITRSTRAAGVSAALVLSHWFLDLIVHRPDLPLLHNDGPLVGLGAWNSMPLTILLEAGLFIGGVVMYLRGTTATDRVGTWATWGLIVFLGLVYVMNIVGPPPPSEQAIAVAGNAMWLFVLLAWWGDRHRGVRSE